MRVLKMNDDEVWSSDTMLLVVVGSLKKQKQIDYTIENRFFHKI